MLRPGILCVVLALLTLTQLSAIAPNIDEPVTISLSGSIRIPKNTMSPLAIVEVRGLDDHTSHAKVKTDANGRFQISATVPEGWYKLFVGSPACYPVVVPLYIDKQNSASMEVSLRTYVLKKAPIRFIPIQPTRQFEGKTPTLQDQAGCWNASVKCPKTLSYQVMGDEVDGRTHCPSGFTDFVLDAGADCIGVYNCDSDTVKLSYCPDLNTSDRGIESVVISDPIMTRRYHIYTSLELSNANLTKLRTENQVDAGFQEAVKEHERVRSLMNVENDGATKALLARFLIESASNTWGKNQVALDARTLDEADKVMMRYPGTWALGSPYTLGGFATLTSTTRVQEHFEALEGANTTDDEFMSNVLASLIQVYDERKEGPVARNYEHLLLGRYASTTYASWFAKQKLESQKLVGHLAKTVRGTKLNGADTEISFPMNPPRLVLLDFWATWCRPCIAEIDHMLTVTDSIRARGIEIIGIAVNDDAEDVAEFRKRKSVPWESIMLPVATTQETLDFYNANAIPQMVLIAPDGNILVQGESLRGDGMLKTIDAVLQAQKR